MKNFLHPQSAAVAIMAVASFCSPLLAAGIDLKPEDIRGDQEKNKQSVAVLQNRFFLKAMRPELGLMIGSILNDGFLDTSLYGGRVGLFVNEWVGLEVQMAKAKVTDTADREALKTLKYKKANPAAGEENTIVNPDVEVNPINGITDFTLVAAPFYGKFNFFNLYIVYSDLYVTGGYSRVDTEQGMLNAFTMSAGPRFYLFDALSFRTDFRNRSWVEQRAGKDSRKNSLSFEFGLSYFFF